MQGLTVSVRPSLLKTKQDSKRIMCAFLEPKGKKFQAQRKQLRELSEASNSKRALHHVRQSKTDAKSIETECANYLTQFLHSTLGLTFSTLRFLSFNCNLDLRINENVFAGYLDECINTLDQEEETFSAMQHTHLMAS